MKEVCRFRSTDRLLDSASGELEQQTIYFASPEQLNDPMEGLRDMVWRGDKIVWLNLLKHYVYCLHWTDLQMKVFGNRTPFGADQIPIWGRWDEPPTPQMDELFHKILARIRDDLGLPDLAERISARGKVRYTELLFYLNGLHLDAIDRIQSVYVELGLTSGTECVEPEEAPDKLILADSALFDLIPEVEAQHGSFSEIMFSISYQMTVGQHLGLKYNLRGANSGIAERNRQLLLLDFTKLYVQQLDKLLWPKWYAACFAKSYHNSSLWANYGDSHKGACLIFDTDESSNSRALSLKRVTGWSSDSKGDVKERWGLEPMPFRDVHYTDKPGEIDFFANIGMLPLAAIMRLWYIDEAGKVSARASHVSTDEDLEPWRKKHWGDYGHDIALKSRDWEHENECRLILHGLLDDSLDDRRRTLTYDFSSLKGIIFGIRTSDEEKVKIVEVIQRKCLENNRADFKFFQAYYSPEYGDIRKHEIRLKFANDSESSEGHFE